MYGLGRVRPMIILNLGERLKLSGGSGHPTQFVCLKLHIYYCVSMCPLTPYQRILLTTLVRFIHSQCTYYSSPFPYGPSPLSCLFGIFTNMSLDVQPVKMIFYLYFLVSDLVLRSLILFVEWVLILYITVRNGFLRKERVVK